MRLALTGAEIGTWTVDLKSNDVFWSESCRAIFGLPFDIPIDLESCLHVVHPDDRKSAMESVVSALASKGEFEIECRSQLPDGTVRWMATRGRGEYDRTGTLRSKVRHLTSPSENSPNKASRA